MISKIIKWTLSAVGIIALAYTLFNIKKDVPVEGLKKKYATAESKFMEIDGMQLHYRDEGNMNDTVPLVLIHGTSSSLFTWDSCVVKWKEKHRVIRFDIPAFGLTGPNKDNNYTIEYYVKIIDEILQKLNIQKCNIAGNSLGGHITWKYAYTHPEKAKKIILIDAAGYAFTPGKGGLGFNIIRTVGKIPVVKNVLYYVTPNSILKRSVEGVYFDKTKITEKTVERYKDFTLREGNRKALVARLTTPINDGGEQIKTLKQPTLIIWGDHDNLIPLECAHKYKKDIKNSELVIIKNSGHVPMEESPEEVIPLVENFIDNK